MSVVCLECFNKLNRMELTENDVKLSKGRKFCSVCRKSAHTTIGWKRLTLFEAAMRCAEKPYTTLLPM